MVAMDAAVAAAYTLYTPYAPYTHYIKDGRWGNYSYSAKLRKEQLLGIQHALAKPDET